MPFFKQPPATGNDAIFLMIKSERQVINCKYILRIENAS